ncbi:hypothetical protein R1sor_005117 [Riccia sorocarpa]|uniref:F-box domain-containing protein n=1 Tax=Riccia sorocarpa TaxID=122646 RepID=A0ABD3HMW2_9MARC
MELLTVVLTNLPGSVLKTFCSVSRSWNALIESPEFARRCSSVESFICYFFPGTGEIDDVPVILRNNLKFGSWEGRGSKPESGVDFVFIAADHGLFCYRLDNTDEHEPKICLCVHNPVTDLCRWIMVPYTFEDGMANRREKSVLGGLIMDQSTGEIRERIIDRSIRCGDEVCWLVGRNTDGGWLRTLIRYNMKLDTWSAVSKLWSYREENTSGANPIHLASFENQLFLVNFDSSSKRRSLRVSEFINLVPGLRKFGMEEFAMLLEQGEFTRSLDGFSPYRAAAGNGTWFVECYRKIRKRPRRPELTVFAFSKNSSVIRLPAVYVDSSRVELCHLAATFKAFA